MQTIAQDILKIKPINRKEEDNYYKAEFKLSGIEYLVFYDEEFNIKSLSWLNFENYDPLKEISIDLKNEIINKIIEIHQEIN